MPVRSLVPITLLASLCGAALPASALAAESSPAGGAATKEIAIATAGHLIHDEKSSRDWFRTMVVEYLDRVAPA